MIDTLRLTAERGARSSGTRRSAARALAAYLLAIDERDGELHCFLHVWTTRAATVSRSRSRT